MNLSEEPTHHVIAGRQLGWDAKVILIVIIIAICFIMLSSLSLAGHPSPQLAVARGAWGGGRNFYEFQGN